MTPHVTENKKIFIFFLNYSHNWTNSSAILSSCQGLTSIFSYLKERSSNLSQDAMKGGLIQLQYFRVRLIPNSTVAEASSATPLVCIFPPPPVHYHWHHNASQTKIWIMPTKGHGKNAWAHSDVH